MIIKSIFKNQQAIPLKYTANGQNVSPALSLDDVPVEAQSLVLIMDDPDAPLGTFDHWIVWDILPSIRHISEGAPEFKDMQVKLGTNHIGQLNYFGPKPPPGKPHRYFIKLYALDISVLNLPEGSDKKQVENKMKGHILAQAELIGIYQHSDHS